MYILSVTQIEFAMKYTLSPWLKLLFLLSLHLRQISRVSLQNPRTGRKHRDSWAQKPSLCQRLWGLGGKGTHPWTWSTVQTLRQDAGVLGPLRFISQGCPSGCRYLDLFAFTIWGAMRSPDPGTKKALMEVRPDGRQHPSMSLPPLHLRCYPSEPWEVFSCRSWHSVYLFICLWGWVQRRGEEERES